MTTIEIFREHLAAVDPAELTREDRLALLDLFEKTIPE
jgi:hypothetical protein